MVQIVFGGDGRQDRNNTVVVFPLHLGGLTTCPRALHGACWCCFVRGDTGRTATISKCKPLIT